ncbi:MAG: hypothetical protein PARBB_00232 [Parabacteroides distasonis]
MNKKNEKKQVEAKGSKKRNQSQRIQVLNF